MSVPAVIFSGIVSTQGNLRVMAKSLAALYSNCQKEWYQSASIGGAVVSEGENVPPEMAAKVADALAHVVSALDSLDQFYQGYVVPNQ